MQLTVSRGYKTQDGSKNEVTISFTGAVGYILLPDDKFQFIYFLGGVGIILKLTPEIKKALIKHF